MLFHRETNLYISPNSLEIVEIIRSCRALDSFQLLVYLEPKHVLYVARK